MSLRIAFIGTSAIAARYVAVFKAAGVVLGPVHSRSRERASSFAADNGLPSGTDDFDEILADRAIDAVLVATEPARHVEMAARALDAGKHVLVEKPLDVSLEKGERLAEMAARTDRVVSVVSQYRFNPVLGKMKDRLDEEAGGHSMMIHLTVTMRRDLGYYMAGNGWRRTDSGFFSNQAIHWLDVLIWFFGEPTNVHAIPLAGRTGIDCSDRAVAMLSYPDGSLATVQGCAFTDRSHPPQLTVFHENGMLDYQELLRNGQSEGRLARMLGRKPKPMLLPDLFVLQVKDFVEAIATGRLPATTVEQAVSAMRLSEALT